MVLIMLCELVCFRPIMLAELGISALRTLFLLRLLLKSVTTGVLVQMYQERNDEVDEEREGEILRFRSALSNKVE